MRKTDDGNYQEVPEADYRAFLRGHPRRLSLKRGKWDEGDRGQTMYFIYDAEAFEKDRHHQKTKTRHMVAYRMKVEGVWRFWVSTKEE